MGQGKKIQQITGPNFIGEEIFGLAEGSSSFLFFIPKSPGAQLDVTALQPLSARGPW